MARRSTRGNSRQTRMFRRLIAELEPVLKEAFLRAVRDLKTDIDWNSLIQALRDRDIESAIAALNVEPAAFGSYYTAIQDAYAKGGALAATTINYPELSPVVIRFDMTNPVAQERIRYFATSSIQTLSDEAKAAARKAILDGYSAGKHPESIARDLAGRMQGGRRVGGVIGLSPDLQLHADNMRARLLSGDPTEIGKVFNMTLRDKGYDERLTSAMAGRNLTEAEVDKMVARYHDRLLKYRGERVARTETGRAVMQGRKDSWDQAAGKFGGGPDSVIKTWVHGGGVKDPRPDHQAMNGVSVTGLNTPFKVGGVDMQHAHDPNGGSKHNAFCSCDTTFRIDHSIGLT